MSGPLGGSQIVAAMAPRLRALRGDQHSGRPGRPQLGMTISQAILALRESHRRGGVRVELPLADRSLAILSSELKYELPRAVAHRMGVPGALPGR